MSMWMILRIAGGDMESSYSIFSEAEFWQETIGILGEILSLKI